MSSRISALAWLGSFQLAAYFALFFVQRNFVSPADPTGLLWMRGMMGLYVALMAALFCAFFLTLKNAREDATDAADFLIWLFPALTCLGAAFCRPVFSEDLWAYLSSGYYTSLPGGSTYLHAASELGQFPVAAEFARYGIVPRTGVSPYGPLWSAIEWLAYVSAPNVGWAAVVLKLATSGAFFVAAWLVSRISRSLWPERRSFALVAFLWNPLLLVEIGFEGHNDIWMIALMLGGLALAIGKRHTAALVAVWLAVLCKYLPLIFFPAFLALLVRESKGARDLTHKLFPALAVIVLLTVALYLPFWAGLETFHGVADMREKTQVALSYWIERILSRVVPAPIPSLAAFAVTDLGFFLFVLWVGWKVRDAHDLVRAYLKITVAYLFLNSKRFWPWYPDQPLSGAAVAESRLTWFLVLFLPLCTRLVAPISPLRNAGWIAERTGGYFYFGVGVLLPGLVLAGLLVTGRRARSR